MTTVNIKDAPLRQLSHVIGHDASDKGGRFAASRLGRMGSLAAWAVPRTQPYYPRTSPAVAASGTIRFTANPAAGETFGLNGTTITVVASGATGNQINRGAALANTLENLIAFLQASTDANLSAALYMLAGGGDAGDTDGTLYITHLTPGAAGNAFALATTTTATLSGATLSGGTDGRTLALKVSLVNALSAGRAVYAARKTINAIPAQGGGKITLLGVRDYDLSATPPWKTVTQAAARSNPAWGAAFHTTNCSAVCIQMKGSTGGGANVVLKVDDQWVTVTPLTVPLSASLFYYYLPLPGSVPHRVEIRGYGAGGAHVQAVWVPQGGDIHPAPVRGPKCAILGDSYCAGTVHTGYGATSWPTFFAEVMGWDDVYNLGDSGTGILATNGATGLKYRDRVADVPVAADVVIVQMSVNDAATAAASIVAEAGLLIDAIKIQAPDADIVFTHVWKGGVETMTAIACAQHDGVRTLCAERGLRFLSLTELDFGAASFTPAATTLAAAASAGATSLSVTAPLAPEETFRFADGTKFLVRDCTGTGPYAVTTASGIQAAQASGAGVTQCGPSLWSGGGRVGTTTGYGTSDVLVASDALHPTLAASRAMGHALAEWMGR